MSGRKRSGAQNRKRKKEAEIAFKKSSVLLAAFLKKAKKEVEAAEHQFFKIRRWRLSTICFRA